MKKVTLPTIFAILFLPLIVFASPQPGASGIGDSLYPGFGNGGYDVSHYRIDMSVTPSNKRVDSTVTITATAKQDLSRFNLDFIGFTIDSITVNGVSATYSRSGQELMIAPRSYIPINSVFTVVVHYAGVPTPINSVAINVPTGWITYDGPSVCPCSYVESEPDGAANFIPVNDHPLDKATYSIRVTVPKPYEVAANGNLIGITDNGSTTTTHTEVTAPMASYLATINISQFDVVTEPGTHGVPIRNYFEVGIGQNYRKLFAKQNQMIGYFQTLFGPYPFDVYGVVVLDNDLSQAIEGQTLSLFGKDLLDPSQDEDHTVPHELAHQWFGDNVSVADWRDIWMNEGFANYAQNLWLEYRKGTKAADDDMQQLYNLVKDNNSLVPPASPRANELFNNGVYWRGAVTLYALRLKVGDDKFFQILRTWSQQHRYGNATTAQFIALSSQVSGQDLTAFLTSWLYNTNVPALPTRASSLTQSPMLNYYSNSPVELTWNRITGATGYWLQIADNPQFASPVLSNSSISSSTLTFNATLDYGIYYWRVQALGSNANAWSAVSSFRVIEP